MPKLFSTSVQNHIAILDCRKIRVFEPWHSGFELYRKKLFTSYFRMLTTLIIYLPDIQCFTLKFPLRITLGKKKIPKIQVCTILLAVRDRLSCALWSQGSSFFHDPEQVQILITWSPAHWFLSYQLSLGNKWFLKLKKKPDVCIQCRPIRTHHALHMSYQVIKIQYFQHTFQQYVCDV